MEVVCPIEITETTTKGNSKVTYGRDVDCEA